MSRPNQHPAIEALFLDHPKERVVWRSFARTTLAPPNLQFAVPNLQRLTELVTLAGDHFGELPRVFDPNDLAILLDFFKTHSSEGSTLGLNSIYDAPGGGGGAQFSPLNGYCLSEYPIWCALTLSVASECAVAFDRVCAHALGEFIRDTADRMDEKTYSGFITEWQERHERTNRSNIARVSHPLAEKSGTVAEIERHLRGLSLPEHHPAWQAFLAATSGDDPNPLDDPGSWGGAYRKTYDLLVSLNSLLDRIDSESGRAGRRLTALRRNPHFLEHGTGCFSRGLDWLVRFPATDGDQTFNGSVDQVVPNVHRLIAEDFSFEELSVPTGLQIYAPAKEDQELPSAALEVRTKWQYHFQRWNNQLLKWSRALITPAQTVIFFRTLFPPGEDLNSLGDDELRTRMEWVGAFNTGLKMATLRSELAITTRETATLGSRVEYLIDRGLFRVAVNLPDLVGLADPTQGGDRRRISNFIHIPDRTGFHLFAERWLKRNANGQARVFLTPQVDSPRATSPSADLTRRLADLGIREALIQQALPRKVHEDTDDVGMISLWGDWDPIHSRTLRHYLSPEARVIERPIDAALLGLIREAKDLYGPKLMPYVRDVEHFDGARPIGAPNCPSSADVTRLNESYARRLACGFGESLDELRLYSNAFTSYHCFFQTAALGYRAIIDPAPMLIRIGDRWFAVFTDKDSEGFHRRIVPVPEIFVEQQRNFDDHRRLLQSIHALRIKSKEIKVPIFGSNGRVSDFRPIDAVHDAGENWKFRLNALRRRMRTRLLERGAPGEPADAWMGHWHVGNCPWMEGSGFLMADLTRLVDEHVSPILVEDGWRPIRSVLTESCQWTAA